MNQTILDSIKVRNPLRETDYYKKIKNKVTTECRITKDKWLEVNCKEIETNLKRNNTDKTYNKVKCINYTPKTRSHVVKDKSRKILFKNEKVAEGWKEYMEELYKGDEIEDEETYIKSEKDVNMNKLGPPITREELYKALINLRNKKATEIDEIPAEVLKNLDNSTTEKIFNIITDCCEKGKILNDFVTSKCITIPKKGDTNECSNYRKISILFHASKILLRVNVKKNGLKNKVENQIGDINLVSGRKEGQEKQY
jgi:hypothetical protein